MLGTIVNVAAIILGSLAGTLFKKAISDKMGDVLMRGIGLCILFIAVQGSLAGKNALVLIISMVLGTIVGEGFDLDKRLNILGEKIQAKVSKNNTSSVSEGFVTSSLLYCVGAMAIVGSLQSGLSGNHDMLFTKSMLDGMTAIILASQFGGLGILLSAFPVFIYQGAITLLSHWIAPFLSDLVVAEMTCVGFVIIIGIGLNMLKITKLKVMNYVPAIFVCGIMVCIIEKIPVVLNFLYG